MRPHIKDPQIYIKIQLAQVKKDIKSGPRKMLTHRTSAVFSINNSSVCYLGGSRDVGCAIVTNAKMTDAY